MLSSHPTRRAQTALVPLLLVCVTLIIPACERETFVPPDPPDEIEEINDVNAYLFRNWATTEENVLEPGMASLIDLLEQIDLDADYKERCFVPDPLTDEDLADIEHPDRDPSDVLAVALVMASAFLPEVHAEEVIINEDQRPTEPQSPEHYERVFVDPTDPSCFPDRECDRLITANSILKDYLLVTMLYDLTKNYRWVEIGEKGTGDWAILARCWIEEEFETDGGAIQLNQTYCLDVFYPRDQGAARYMALWPESYIEGVNDEFIYETTAMGMDELFVASEEYLAAI